MGIAVVAWGSPPPPQLGLLLGGVVGLPAALVVWMAHRGATTAVLKWYVAWVVVSALLSTIVTFLVVFVLPTSVVINTAAFFIVRKMMAVQSPP